MCVNANWCPTRVCFGSFTIPFVHLLYTNNFIKKPNKFLKKDLKNLTNWLNANKITLNFDKTDMILFKSTKWNKTLPNFIS